MNNLTLGTRLKQLRSSQNLSQAELSARLGISRSAVASYENGSRNPDYDILIRLGQFFQVSLDYLLGLEEPPSHLASSYKLLDEIYSLLRSAPIKPEEKEQIIQEITAYFKWKLYQAQESRPSAKE